MEKNLKPYQYYADLYDRHTVERARRMEASGNDDPPIKIEDKELTKEQVGRMREFVNTFILHFENGERYSSREKVIREWMDKDRKRDELYEFAQAPEDIRCLTCRNRMKPTFKELWSELEKEDRVLFMYDCPNKCLPHRAFFSDGEEWRTKPSLCLRCKTPLETKMDDDGKKLVTTNSCPKCGYAETDEYEWTHTKEEAVDENYAKDRDRFCLNKEDGEKYEEEKWHWEQMGKVVEEWKKEDQERAEKLKKNPKGFHLEGAGYTCFICRGSTPEGDNWYDEHGIKCLVCQKAIDESEIPASLASDKDSWYSKYDMEHYFGVKSHALRSWVKKGIIKARTVSRYGQGEHTRLFLIQDNEGFLPPKNILESHVVTTRKEGKEWQHVEPWYRFVDPREHLKDYKIMDYLKVTEENDSE